MTKREKALIHYAVIMTIHDDALRMATTLRKEFTAEERQEIKDLATKYSKWSVTERQAEAFNTLRGIRS